MLSYQHIYHAGNLADVHKHMALATVLARLMTAGKPLTYIETHAGRGIYNLASPEALKTNEAESGISALQTSIPADHPYAKVIAKVRQEHGLNFYPGSPYIARSILSKSQLHLFELHPKEFAALKENIKGVNLHNKNGYDGAYNLCPPKERRGLILIDPSYELKDEYMDAAFFVEAIRKKWPEAVILLWYPLLDAGNHNEMTGYIKNAWKQEVTFKESKRIRGSGLIAINLRPETIKELDKIKELF